MKNIINYQSPFGGGIMQETMPIGIELDTSRQDGARIRVIGIGGGGGNAINNMISKGLQNVDFIVANTDKQALEHNLSKIKIQVGREITRGLGAGADPDIGRKSVEENYEEIKDAIKGSDMLFITGGMGGGTGTGGSPVVAKIAQELGSLVVGIVTKPFDWEAKKRKAVAEEGIEELKKYVDALIVIPNQRLLDIIDRNTGFREAFQKVDEVLYNATRGIADIISVHGLVNVDFADVRTIMKQQGDALMGIGTAKGESRAVEATQNALNSPLLDGISVAGAKGVLINITGGSDITMHEISEAVQIVENATGSDVLLIHGVVCGEEPKDEIMVTVVATGFNRSNSKPEKNPAKPEIEVPVHPKIFPTNGNPIAGKGPITIRTATDNSRTVYSSSHHEIKKPTGNLELKSYDEPAFMRKEADEENNISQHISKIENTESNRLKTEYDSRPKISDKPAYLRRKIMD
jgi:cell division protein FtsZ